MLNYSKDYFYSIVIEAIRFFLLITALTKVYEKANSVVSYEVNCPTWLHKYIIGRKGAGIQKLTGELQKVTILRLGIKWYTILLRTVFHDILNVSKKE